MVSFVFTEHSQNVNKEKEEEKIVYHIYIKCINMLNCSSKNLIQSNFESLLLYQSIFQIFLTFNLIFNE